MIQFKRIKRGFKDILVGLQALLYASIMIFGLHYYYDMKVVVIFIVAFLLLFAIGTYVTWKDYFLVKDGLRIDKTGIKFEGLRKYLNTDFIAWYEIDDIRFGKEWMDLTHQLIINSDNRKIKLKLMNLEACLTPDGRQKLIDEINKYKN